MRSLVQKVRAVERLFRHLDQEVRQFQQATRLQCVTGCGACCVHPETEASVLEFLPFAYACYLQGKAEEMLEQLRENPGSSCHLFRLLHTGKNSGYCSQYPHRGLICRLFGFSAVLDKYGSPRLYTCRIIRTGQAAEAEAAQASLLRKTLNAPMVRAYYQRLMQIDFRLSQSLHPINEALCLALEEVLAYYAYRPRRKAA